MTAIDAYRLAILMVAPHPLPAQGTIIIIIEQRYKLVVLGPKGKPANFRADKFDI